MTIQSTRSKDSRWYVLGKSVRGASHFRANRPNQDAIDWLQETEAKLPVILAVADGHGSAKYIRSEVGAQLAVKSVVEGLQLILDRQEGTHNLSLIQQYLEEKFPRIFVEKWKEEVLRHFETNPVREEEWDALAERTNQDLRSEIEGNPILAYGATVLGSLVTDDFMLFLQLGDGDIITVLPDGETMRVFSKDSRMIANETFSLCMSDAWKEMVVSVIPVLDRPPALILLSTDGYSNSFRDEQGFLQVGSDLLGMFYRHGLQYVESELEAILEDATKAGSGDDITLGIIRRVAPEDPDAVKFRLGAVETELQEKVSRDEAPDLIKTQMRPIEVQIAEIGDVMWAIDDHRRTLLDALARNQEEIDQVQRDAADLGFRLDRLEFARQAARDESAKLRSTIEVLQGDLTGFVAVSRRLKHLVVFSICLAVIAALMSSVIPIALNTGGFAVQGLILSVSSVPSSSAVDIEYPNELKVLDQDVSSAWPLTTYPPKVRQATADPLVKTPTP